MGRLKASAGARTKAFLGKLAPLIRKPTPHAYALSTLLLGGATTAFGMALIYIPAGVILAGLQLTALALLVINVPRAK